MQDNAVYPRSRILLQYSQTFTKKCITKCNRVNELVALLHLAWQQKPDLNLVQFLLKLGQEAGYQGDLRGLTDDILIYHLKMRGSHKMAAIPGLAKDYEEDFKSAILRARGIIKK